MLNHKCSCGGVTETNINPDEKDSVNELVNVINITTATKDNPRKGNLGFRLGRPNFLFLMVDEERYPPVYENPEIKAWRKKKQSLYRMLPSLFFLSEEQKIINHGGK